MTLPDPLRAYLASLSITPFPFQDEAWERYAAGESGLIHAPTGMGKTWAAWLGPVARWLHEHPDPTQWPTATEPIRVLWLTPLRALAADTLETLKGTVGALGLPWEVAPRTGDTSSHIKARQKQVLPTALITTPESLSLLLSQPRARQKFATLHTVVVDEWHELLGSKRGVQTELCLARLRSWLPDLQTWGLSATLGNLDTARDVLLGVGRPGALVAAPRDKRIEVTTLLPETMDRFPWAGHLGTGMLDATITAIDAGGATLLFTNTRSQAELWYQAILAARPDWEGTVALHHGSLDRAVRQMAEEGIRNGRLRALVCTSSLDLGVDFSPVDQVIQVGSPKGIARLIQRAGRSGHRPGMPSRVIGVPTNALELIEFSAAREAVQLDRVEARMPLLKPLDLLAQHLVTLAAGGGFREEQTLQEIRGTHAFADLTDQEWRWVMDFLERGGPALRAYPEYARIAEQSGVYKVLTNDVASRHRLTIGTITSASSMRIKFHRGGTIGSVEEGFLARLNPGDTFLFGGRTLSLVSIRDDTATVRLAKGRASVVPRWMGGRMPLSTLLADAVLERFAEVARGVYTDAETTLVSPVLETQRELSHLPVPGVLLVEFVKTREGHHAFVHTFAGRLANEGLAALVAFRIARDAPRTITTMCNDYTFELLCRKSFDQTEEKWRQWLSPDDLAVDLLECLNATELARRRFRDIARVAGLVFEGLPGRTKSLRQIQSSSGLLFDVFNRFDPENLLLQQARREVLENQLDIQRLDQWMTCARDHDYQIVSPDRLTPLAFPVWAERIREHVSSEKWEERVRSMIESIDKAVAP